MYMIPSTTPIPQEDVWILSSGTYYLKKFRVQVRALLLPVFDDQTLAGTFDGEFLAFAPAEFSHDVFGDVDVVTFPSVFNYFSCLPARGSGSGVFLHIKSLP